MVTVNDVISRKMSNQLSTGKGQAGTKFTALFNVDCSEEELSEIIGAQLGIILNKVLGQRFGLDSISRKDCSEAEVIERQGKLKSFLEGFGSKPMGVSVSELLEEEDSFNTGRTKLSPEQKEINRLTKEIGAGKLSVEAGMAQIAKALEALKAKNQQG